jgi:hypothetical protein
MLDSSRHVNSSDTAKWHRVAYWVNVHVKVVYIEK